MTGPRLLTGWSPAAQRMVPRMVPCCSEDGPLLRRYVTTYSKGSILTHRCFSWLKSSGICLAGEERMHHISSQIVGDNPNREIALFSGGQVNSCQILGLTFAPMVLVSTRSMRADHRVQIQLYRSGQQVEESCYWNVMGSVR